MREQSVRAFVALRCGSLVLEIRLQATFIDHNDHEVTLSWEEQVRGRNHLVFRRAVNETFVPQ